MKKYVFLFTFLMIFSSAQTVPDLNAIQKNVNDVSSPFFYEKLVYKFNYDPNVIGAEEANHLYYGKLYTDYRRTAPESLAIAKEQLNVLIGDKNFAQAARDGEALVRNNPADLEVLGLLMYAFLQQDMGKNELTYLRAAQFKKMIDAVFTSRTGDNKHPVFTVTSIADEYVLAGILNLDLKNFKRQTTYNNAGALDYWKKGSAKISFQVIYAE